VDKSKTRNGEIPRQNWKLLLSAKKVFTFCWQARSLLRQSRLLIAHSEGSEILGVPSIHWPPRPGALDER
jgi:hypothetical protein